jgi:spore coat polysaccharide biosynthesis protein SpsF
MGSKRLPGKALMKISGKPMLEHIIDRLKTSKTIDSIIVATTTQKRDEEIIELAKTCGVNYFAGDEDDVLGRFVKAADKGEADIIVRVTSDNPLIDVPSLDNMVKTHIERKVDYTFNINDTSLNFYKNGIALGLGAEVVSADALRKVFTLAKKPYQREHVTIFMEEHPELFKILHVKAPSVLQKPNIRLTVDTKEDLQLVRKIYTKLYQESKVVDSRQAVRFLEENPELLEINKQIRQKSLARDKA